MSPGQHSVSEGGVRGEGGREGGGEEEEEEGEGEEKMREGDMGFEMKSGTLVFLERGRNERKSEARRHWKKK